MPAQWPRDGWYRIRVGAGAVVVTSERAQPGAAPPFLSAIIGLSEAYDSNPDTVPDWEDRGDLFLRVPGKALPARKSATLRFGSGRSTLVPVPGRRYALKFMGHPLALTVESGLRGSNGAPYADGAVYRITYRGRAHRYRLGQHGWNTRVAAIADIDGDKRPDFIVVTSGAGDTAILLS